MSESIQKMFESFNELFDYSKQMAVGSETLARIHVDDVEVGTTPKTKVASFDKVTLYRYESTTKKAPTTEPVLIVYGLIGRYTMIDLQEDRSLVRNLLDKGVDLYVVDWGYPSRADQFLSFDDYGICEGGVFCSMYAATFPERVKNMIVSISPIDFAADVEDENPANGFINLWTRNLDAETINSMIDVHGNLPGEVMGAVFQALTPMRTMTKYNLDLANMASDQNKLLNFLRMEKWLADRPHHPGAAAKQWLVNLYQQNQLVEGKFVLEGEYVDLDKIDMPVLNVFAEKDHIIPPPCSKALGKYISSKDYTEMPLNGGHVGIYVSGKLQHLVSQNIYEWLAGRQ